jgi:hypothetical protein
MSKRLTPNVYPLAAVLGLALSAGACVISVDSAVFAARDEKRFAVTGKPDLTIVTFDGTIEIRAWDRPEVVVEVEKRASDKALVDAIQVKTEQVGNRIIVEVPRPSTNANSLRIGHRAFFGYVDSSARLTVSVPRESDLTARTGDGSITIERVSGRLELTTGDGSIRATDLGGSLKAHSDDGSLRLVDINGWADVDTGDGGIELTGTLSAVRARTGDGSVTVRAEPGSATSDAWEIRTGDGGITVEVPDTFGAELDASTGDGSVRVEGPTLTVAGERERRSVRGTMAGGGRLLRIRTGSGSIHIRRF